MSITDSTEKSTIKNNLKVVLMNSPQKLFYIEKVNQLGGRVESKIYNNKKKLLKDLAGHNLAFVNIYGVFEYNIFNYVNPKQGHTNLAIIKKMHENSSIKLNLKDYGYLLVNDKQKHSHVIAVSELIEDILKQTDAYPTVGNAEDGSIKFAPEVKVYKVVSKLI